MSIEVRLQAGPPEQAASAVAVQRKRVGFRAYIGTFGTSVIIQAFSVVQGIIIARLLGPVGRGEYATVILWPNVFAAIGIFGTNIALARAAAKTARYDAVIRTALFLALITAAISSASCYFLLPYLLPQAESHLLGLSQVFVLFILLNHVGLNLVAVDQGAANFRRFNLTRAAVYPIYASFLAVLWVNGVKNVKWVVLGAMAANLVVVLLRLVLVLRDMRLWGHLYSLSSTIRESAQFGLVGAAMPLYQQVDKAVLLWLLGARNLGLYVVALSASAAVGSITNATGLVSFTVAAQARQGDGFTKITRAFRVSALLWVIFGVPLAMAMPVLLPFVYGADFNSAAGPARLLILGSAFAGLANLLDQALRGQGRALIGFEARIAGLVAISVGGILLSKRLGLPGMCVAYGLAQVICLSFFIWRVLGHYGQHALMIRSFIPGWSDMKSLSSHICATLIRVAPK